MQFPISLNLNREFPAVETLKVSPNTTFRNALAAVAAVALGLVAGASVAALSWPGSATMAKQTPAPASSSVAAMNAPQAVNQAAQAASPAVNSPIAAAPVKALVALESAAPAVQPAAPKVSAALNSVVKSAPEASPVAPVIAASLPDDATKSFSLFVEGDVTVADYDATTGMISTNDGKTFVINKLASLNWQDSIGNVHYRCDQGGNCTLMGGGVVVPNARMTT
jgi:hypothetical protein